MTNKERGRKNNAIGELGELIAEKLIPSGIWAKPKNQGFDLWALNGARIEVKTSTFNKKVQRWQWKPSYSQIMTADYFLFLALDQFGGLFKAFLVPITELDSNEPMLSEVNLEECKQWEVA